MGPAILVTVGVLFLLDNVGRLEFHRTWPAILLVIGVVKLVQSNASYGGHIGPLASRNAAGHSPRAFPHSFRRSTGASELQNQPTSSGEVKNV